MDSVIDRQTMVGSSNTHLASQILHALKSSKGLAPSQAWLSSFLSSQRPGLPINALVSTAAFRLLATDIKSGLDASKMPVFPASLVNVNVKETRVTGPIVVQVLDVEDMSRSRWAQIEELESDERGEKTRGREIIRVAPPASGEEADNSTGDATDSSRPSSGGAHKLLVEDVKGTKVYAIEMKKLDGVHLGMNIGTKLLLRDVTVARGVLLLEPGNVTTLGGKVDALHQHWRANRKAQLRAAIPDLPVNE